MPATRRLLAVALILLGLGLLFLPGVERPADRLAVYLRDLLHVVLFAALALLMLVAWPRRRGSFRVAAAVVAVCTALAAGAELLQPLTGRDRELGDALLGVAGCLIAVCWHGAAGRVSRGVRVALVAAGMIVLSAVLLPAWVIVDDRMDAHRDFPVLASFESRAELGRWTANGCRIGRALRHATEGRFSLDLEVVDPGEYPGVFLVDMPRDWSRFQQLCADLYLDGSEPRDVWLRIDDRDNPSYAERFQTMFHLLPGSNRVCLLRRHYGVATGGRPLDLDGVTACGVFFAHGRVGDRLYIDHLVLSLPEDAAD